MEKTRQARVKQVTRKVTQQVTVVEKQCPAPGCGKTFWGRPNQRFHSPQCRNRANYHRHAEEYRAGKVERYRKEQAAKPKKKAK